MDNEHWEPKKKIEGVFSFVLNIEAAYPALFFMNALPFAIVVLLSVTAGWIANESKCCNRVQWSLGNKLGDAFKAGFYNGLICLVVFVIHRVWMEKDVNLSKIFIILQLVLFYTLIITTVRIIAFFTEVFLARFHRLQK